MYLTMNTLYAVIAFIAFSGTVFFTTKLVCYGCDKKLKKTTPEPDANQKIMDTPKLD